MAILQSETSFKCKRSFTTSELCLETLDRLEPIFISRFLLNLRNLRERRNEIQDAFVGNSPSSISRFHVPRFRVPTLASVIGDIGEELDHECEDELDDGIDASSLCDSGRRSEYIREDPQEI
ncbi:hypothetical protein PHLCEN_2v12016 [Hermanssonia centrifuga]|uniref:Uncharacterized protein n=1 Tax=Hermanssonia centrifuga TaxID=98765 RepID=A0A2R6NIH6_9APHY|nr:hypothetical protein PHLCEN_2v12016 [Hermanssonia centrifuga]